MLGGGKELLDTVSDLIDGRLLLRVRIRLSDLDILAQTSRLGIATFNGLVHPLTTSVGF